MLRELLIGVVTAIPNPAPAAPPGMDGPANMLLSWMKWAGIISGLLGFGMCAIMMILGRRNRSNMATVADPLVAQLLSRSGPFASCSAGRHETWSALSL